MGSGGGTERETGAVPGGDGQGADKPALVLFDQARVALAKAHSIDEVKRVRDQAEAMRAYVRQAHDSLDMANQCAELKLRAERKLGSMLQDTLRHQGGRPGRPSHDASVSPPTVDELGINRSQSSRWQKIAAVPDPVFQRYVDLVMNTEDEELTTAGLLRASKRQNTTDAIGSSESNEWYTPSEYVDAARSAMGSIDLDPASSSMANKVVKATRYFSIDDGGLSKDWYGCVFMNPPYGLTAKGKSSQDYWSSQLIERFERGDVDQAVLLVNAATDAGWFRKLWEYPICFVHHRIRFDRPTGKGKQPTHGNVFVYLGMSPERFLAEFKAFGRIVVPAGDVGQVLAR